MVGCFLGCQPLLSSADKGNTTYVGMFSWVLASTEQLGSYVRMFFWVRDSTEQ